MDSWGYKLISTIEVVAKMVAIRFGLPKDAFTSLMKQLEMVFPDRAYAFFSQTHKTKKENMPLLDKILAERATLYDYELIAGDNGKRLIAFGKMLDLVLRLDVYKKLDKHRGCVNTVSFNSDGDILVSGSDDRRVILWDWQTGNVKLLFHSGHSNSVFQAKIMPYTDDCSIVTFAADGQVISLIGSKVLYLQLESNEKLLFLFMGH
ncbi:hypothetical protein Q3G72_019030 [Acer saccharum]|nr:hypothetical protein Q3G72_019030 [Acer saccharum]